MGSNGLCNLFSCFKASSNHNHGHGHGHSHSHNHNHNQSQLVFAETEPLDETLGHSFCYVRSSARFLSPSHSDRILSPSNSLRFSPSHRSDFPETAFKAISGASVSANSSVPKTVLQSEDDDTTVNGFRGTASFSALPLQPAPRGGETLASERERRAFFLSGPIESGALSGPLDDAVSSSAGVPFSAPLGGGVYVKKKRKKSIAGLRKAFQRSLSEKKRPWVVPVGRKGKTEATSETENESNVQWALGKAGEDRVHVVVSEEQGWLFVGIYDGFNGPDAPEFLMGNLYRALHKELQGLFWELEEPQSQVQGTNPAPEVEDNEAEPRNEVEVEEEEDSNSLRGSVKRVTFQAEGTESRRRRLWEFLAEEDDAENGLDLSGSDRFAFSVDDALSASKEDSEGSRRWLILSKLKHGLSRHKEGHGRSLLPWSLGVGVEEKEKEKVENPTTAEEEEEEKGHGGRKRKVGPVDHELVLRALSRALEMTELAYLDMTDKLIDTNPELALMGSCLLAVLMRDDDVYVMNVGDSRAIVAHYECEEVDATSKETGRGGGIGSSGECIVEESSAPDEGGVVLGNEGPARERRLVALQLSTDHSTSIEEEVVRIKNEHPDDSHCIVNDRVKGRLKVTRAFGAGFLKQPKWNDVVLEMFRNEYIGTAPYISCCPSLRHYRLCPRDQFLILSSDGLYQYLSNQEVVSQVQSFMEKFPDGDPAQHLIEELLLRAAKKAGMDFHELLDIPQGDRRKYHDDVTVMVISLEGRIWKSSGKYP
ncbi:hypothetical protein VNO80_09694 [Phaseolus coccineus]|uniref:PPM-type phosphatase domain-containing protein n=1 Tax=Phaseolus coccineus TaxID=3886 RepID=A0AAN9N8I1_PHACN